MPRPNALIIEDGYATLAVAKEWEDVDVIETTALAEDCHVRINDGWQYPQLCKGGKRLGQTLIFTSNEQLARDCNARLFKTRKAFDAAVARMDG